MRLSLPQAARVVRRRICDHCPRAVPRQRDPDPSVPRSCEVGCPLFRELHRVARILQYRDPMLRSPAETICRELGRPKGAPAGEPRDPARQYRRQLAEVLTLLAR